METGEGRLVAETKDEISKIFSEFMTRVAKFDELVAVGNRLLVGFQQGLDFLRQPPIDKTSELVKHIIKANETKRMLSYVEAGCVNTHDSVQNMSKSKCILNELERLVEDVTHTMQTCESSLQVQMKDINDDSYLPQTSCGKVTLGDPEICEPEITDYAAMMGVIYSMVKQDFMVQERIVTSLNLKSSSGELESYCLMWSLRPFIDEDVVRQAWEFIT